MKKWMIGLAAATVCTAGASAALVMGLLTLPGYQVGVSHSGGTNSFFVVTLSGIVNPPDYSVQNGVPYLAWCAEDNGVAPASLATLYDSTDTANLPAGINTQPWDKVNYVLNHKGSATVQDIQIAIWILTYGFSSLPSTPGSDALLAAANANGVGYVPPPGGVVAVIVYTDGIQPVGNTSIQESIFEVPTPPVEGYGCTPGFWKNDGGKFGFNNWKPTGYAPTDVFNTVFGVNYLPAGMTLLESLTPTNNNGYGNLIWHGTAALLNAAHPDVNYAYTVAEVIAFVQAGDATPLVYANEYAPCPLSRIRNGDGDR